MATEELSFTRAWSHFTASVKLTQRACLAAHSSVTEKVRSARFSTRRKKFFKCKSVWHAVCSMKPQHRGWIIKALGDNPVLSGCLSPGTWTESYFHSILFIASGWMRKNKRKWNEYNDTCQHFVTVSLCLSSIMAAHKLTLINILGLLSQISFPIYLHKGDAEMWCNGKNGWWYWVIL